MQMASSSSSSSSKSPPPPSRHSPQFTPIQEEPEDEFSEDRSQSRATPSVCTDSGQTPKPHHVHIPTPLRWADKSSTGKSKHKKRSEYSGGGSGGGDDGSVSCNKCRPHAREKISVVPFDNGPGKHHSSSSLLASPNGIFKSILFTLTRKSPKPPSSDAAAPSAAREEQWKIAVAELSHKLIQATRKKDEAVLEASRLKHSMVELEKKLNKVELYCLNLKSGLEECSINNTTSPHRAIHNNNPNSQNHQNAVIIERFLVSVSEARSSVRLLSRALTMQLRHMGGKVYDRVSALLQPYDIKISSSSKNPRGLIFYLESLLNRAFFEDFESVGFQRNASNHILNPIQRCEASFQSFNRLNGLTWEEVLNKGTRHFSEEFSRFCDRKMSEIVGMLGWNRAWPEPLLQAFFGASKSVWMVHLLATSVHPGLTIFRVDKNVRFESVYMEDMGSGDKASKLVPSMVRIMVAPGFYVYGSVVKCKVICRYLSNKIEAN
ncbi:IRK-interacting protein [Senna tora]|uniref:IRK-interacting protein n=1 Tax=Senna tora TaxID=362788 RepID=A0A834WAN8_9FABA|nr:IRK-interacting protein [Senna tora]